MTNFIIISIVSITLFIWLRYAIRKLKQIGQEQIDKDNQERKKQKHKADFAKFTNKRKKYKGKNRK